MKKRTRTVFLRPVERTTVHGYHNLTWTIKNATGETVASNPFKATKAYGKVKTSEVIMFPIDHSNNKLITGLDELMSNPFKGRNAQEIKNAYALDSSWSNGDLEHIVEADEITKQVYYEIEHKRPKDFYTSHLSGYTIFNIPKNQDMRDLVKSSTPSYLQSFKYFLYDDVIRIQSGTPKNDLALELIKIHPLIAKSKEEQNSAYHIFYISEENEERAEKLAKVNQFNLAISELVHLLTKQSDSVIFQVASLLTWKNGRPLVIGEVSSDTVKERLNDYLHTTDARSKPHNIKKFLDVYKMAKSSKTRALFHVHFIFQQALNYKVITPVDGYFIWHAKYDQPNLHKLGTNKSKVIAFFLEQYKIYDPASDLSNIYKDLEEELKRKGAKVD